MVDLIEAKKRARQAAFAARKIAHAEDRGAGTAQLRQALSRFSGNMIAGYMPIKTEIDPLPALAQMLNTNSAALPVIEAENQPLRFSRWSPETPLRAGPFGAQVPIVDDFVSPDIVIVPLVAFTRSGARLGYGGGFYDRTLEQLRKSGSCYAIGFAYAAQELDDLPQESTDEPLDIIVTDQGVITPR